VSGIQIGRIGCIPDEYLDATGAFDRSALSSCDLFGVPPVIAAARLDMRLDHFISRVLGLAPRRRLGRAPCSSFFHLHLIRDDCDEHHGCLLSIAIAQNSAEKEGKITKRTPRPASARASG
jgi:hypothetical protein